MKDRAYFSLQVFHLITLLLIGLLIWTSCSGESIASRATPPSDADARRSLQEPLPAPAMSATRPSSRHIGLLPGRDSLLA